MFQVYYQIKKIKKRISDYKEYEHMRAAFILIQTYLNRLLSNKKIIRIK